jgi:transcriptional regulator GlxA family with amidase domain
MKFILALLYFSAFAASADAAKQVKNVAIFVYDSVEILDFGGPSEVFAVAGDFSDEIEFNVYTVALSKATILSQGFITIVPQYSIDDCPKPDIIVLPGGDTRTIRENARLIAWIKASSRSATVTLSVCSGAFLLANAGLLDGLKATTWYGSIENLRKASPKTEVLEKTRFVDNGSIITTAGVSAGIDGALHVVARLLSNEAAQKTAQYMEYDKWEPNDGLVVKKSGVKE